MQTIIPRQQEFIVGTQTRQSVRVQFEPVSPHVLLESLLEPFGLFRHFHEHKAVSCKFGKAASYHLLQVAKKSFSARPRRTLRLSGEILPKNESHRRRRVRRGRAEFYSECHPALFQIARQRSLVTPSVACDSLFTCSKNGVKRVNHD